MIDTLLVANRGEIACRVMRTAKAMGIRTVAVHSAIDANARHVREADMAVNLGGAKPGESYLLIDKIIAAAKASGVLSPNLRRYTENAIARIRVSPEGQEGLNAFLEKRTPAWQEQ